jgi:large subunit ribosomal protein L29
MKASDYRNKTSDELLAEGRSLLETLFNKRFQTEIDQVSSPAQLKFMRRDIARIKTVLRERGLKMEV